MINFHSPQQRFMNSVIMDWKWKQITLQCIVPNDNLHVWKINKQITITTIKIDTIFHWKLWWWQGVWPSVWWPWGDFDLPPWWGGVLEFWGVLKSASWQWWTLFWFPKWRYGTMRDGLQETDPLQSGKSGSLDKQRSESDDYKCEDSPQSEKNGAICLSAAIVSRETL